MTPTPTVPEGADKLTRPLPYRNSEVDSPAAGGRWPATSHLPAGLVALRADDEESGPPPSLLYVGFPYDGKPVQLGSTHQPI